MAVLAILMVGWMRRIAVADREAVKEVASALAGEFVQTTRPVASGHSVNAKRSAIYVVFDIRKPPATSRERNCPSTAGSRRSNYGFGSHRDDYASPPFSISPDLYRRSKPKQERSFTQAGFMSLRLTII
jgi:hypothetical protein